MEPKYLFKMALFSGYHGSLDYPQPYLSGCFYPVPEKIKDMIKEFEKHDVRVEISKDGKITCSAKKDNSEFLNKFNDVNWLKSFY